MKKHDFRAMLRDAGLKAMPARLSVLDALSKGHRPMDAEDVREATKGKIDLVTVYRTLRSLQKAGIAKRVDLRRASAYYELQEHHHHHMVCTSCGAVERFDMCHVGKVSKEALKGSSMFEKITEHSLELFGLCKSCA